MQKKQRRKTSKYVRTTITVPSELKARMEKIRNPVNWSQLAAEAFAEKLDEMASGAACTLSLEAMARRLRANRWEVDTDYGNGWQLGRSWAIQQADLGHLVRLERLCRMLTDDDWLRLAMSSAGTAADQFLLRLYPEIYQDPSRREAFWNSATSGSVLLGGIAFVKGFFEGALDAWLWVKDDVGVLGWWCPTLATEADRIQPQRATEHPQSQECVKVRVRRKVPTSLQQLSGEQAVSNDEGSDQDDSTRRAGPRQTEQQLA